MIVPPNAIILLGSIAGFGLITALGKLTVGQSGLSPYNYIIAFAAGMTVNHCAILVAARWHVKVIVESKVRALAHILLESFCMPMIYFYLGYTINLNFLKHSKTQVFTLGISANLIQIVLLTFLLNNSQLFEEYNSLCLIFISTLCMPYTTRYSVELLRNSTTFTKHLEQLLEGEGFVSTLMASLLLNSSHLGSHATLEVTYTQLTSRLGAFATACLIGVIIGTVVFPMITKIDGVAAICFSVGAIFFSTFFSLIIQEATLEVTPLLLGITLSRIKRSTDKKEEDYLDKFWAWQFYTLEYLVFMISGVKSAFRYTSIYDDAIKALLMYFYTILLRGLIWFFWYFLMNSIFGITFPFKIVFICIFAAYKSSPPLLIAFDNLIHIDNTKSERGIGSIISFVVCFHCLFSSLLVPCLFKYSGLTDFSKKRVQRIDNLLKKITSQKQKTMEILQESLISANANWRTVDYLTDIHKPVTRFTNIEDLIKSRDICLKNLANSLSTDEESSSESSISQGINDGLDEKIRKRSSQDLVAKEEETDRYIKNSIRKKILEMETISYGRQLTEEIMSKRTHLLLTTKWEAPSLEKSWKRKKINWPSSYDCLTKIHDYFQNFKTLRKPDNTFRSSFFEMITSPSYNLFLATIIILDSLSQLLLVYFYYTQKKTPSYGVEKSVWNTNINIYANYLQATDYFCYGLFLGEFFFQIFGWGLIQYFQQKTWFIEFSVSIIIRSVEQIMLHTDVNNEDILQVNETIMFFKAMLILRLAVLNQYFKKSCFSYIKNFVEYLKNSHLMKYYEKGYGTAIGHGDILQYYQNIFGSTQRNRKIKLQWLKIRNSNKINMSLLAEKGNEMAVAMKSKQVAINVLKDAMHHIHELKQTGHVHEFERRILKKQFKKIKNRVKNLTKVTPPEPVNLLQQVYWLRGDKSCSHYFTNHAEMVTFKAKERIIEFGKQTSDLYLIISGICRYLYKPTVKSLHKLLLFGMLPNSDYYLHFRFKEVQQDIIEPGNLIGEFGLITGRPYNIRVCCETNVKAIKIPYPHLIKLFHKCHFGNIRHAKLWKTIGIRFCIKHFLPYFKRLSREILISQLHNSLVPLLETVKLVNLNDDISEVVLIEGTAKDSLTRRHLSAPLFIKAEGQKLIINYENIPNDIPTRLMLIPKHGRNIVDVVKSNEVFKDYFKYIRFIPKPLGEDMCLKTKNKIKVIRQFLKKHKKYMLIDFMLQINDPKIGIPCCIGSEQEKCIKIKRKKRHLSHDSKK